jgi:hypothetical protein
VFGAACAAFSNVLLKARVIQLAPSMIAGWQMIFGAAPLLVSGLIMEGNPAQFHWSALSLFCLLYLAVIGSALTFLLLYWLAAAPDRCAVAKHFAYHPARSDHARLADRRRNVPGVVPIGRSVRPCWGMDDFPKSKRAGASDSRGLIA